MGLWSGVGDLSAVEQLSRVSRGRPLEVIDAEDWEGRSELVHPHVFVPLSSMNLMLSRRAVPLFYFPPIRDEGDYHRFDDIWAGLVAQVAMRRLGLNWSVGCPVVEHTRASCAYQNLRLEAPGIAVNETLWKFLNATHFEAGDTTTELVLKRLSVRIGQLGAGAGVLAPPAPNVLNVRFFERWSTGLRQWAGRF